MPSPTHSMQDHTYFSIILRSNPSTSLTSIQTNLTALQTAAFQYATTRTGPFTTGGGPTFGFQKLSSKELKSLGATELLKERRENQAHIEYLTELAYFPAFPYPGYPPKTGESYISITAGLLAPVSRGSVMLKSGSMMDAPVINLNVSSFLAYVRFFLKYFEGIAVVAL